nr:sulfotransferase [Salsipaludibacter albus]
MATDQPRSGAQTVHGDGRSSDHRAGDATDGPSRLHHAGVVLVVGAMRTGTTLVARLLDSHSEVDYLGFELAEDWSAWTGLPWGAPGADDVACPPLHAMAASPSMARRTRAGLTRMRRDRDVPRRNLVVVKSPHFWHRLPFMLALLPGARVVRTRRGMLPTVASLGRLWDRALRDHGRLHHLPEAPDACWDFVPADRADEFDPARTFPGGDVRVLAEFHGRVEDHLDEFERARPGTVVATVEHERLVRAPGETTSMLQRSLGLPVRRLRPPEPLDPARCEEWRWLLDDDDLRTLGVDPDPSGAVAP